MKKNRLMTGLSALMATTMLFSLAGCSNSGQKTPTQTSTETTKAQVEESTSAVETAEEITTEEATTEEATTEEVTTEEITTEEETEAYVEEIPEENALDESNPIPSDTGTLALESQVFDDLYLVLNLPDSVTAVSDGNQVTVTDIDGEWEISFRPYIDALTNESNIKNNYFYDGQSKKIDWSQDIPTTLCGFSARVWANNIYGAIQLDNETMSPGVDVLVDYGETLVGPYYGMVIHIRPLSNEEGTSIYPILYRRAVRAILNNFEVIETKDGITVDREYVTATIPSRWTVHESAMILNYRVDGVNRSINMSPTFGADPAEVAKQYVEEADVKTYAIGDRTFYGGVSETTVAGGDGNAVLRTLYLFTEFSDTHSLRVACSISGADKEELESYANDTDLTAVLSSLILTPEKYSTHNGEEVNGIYSALGTIFDYDGTDTEVIVPAVIGDYETYRIAYSAFANNTTITKLELPEGVVELEPHCFSGMTALETIVLPSTLTTIPEYCFRGCTNLKNIVLGENILEVGANAFYEAGLGSFEDAGNVKYGKEALAQSGFETITFGNGSDVSADRLMYSAKANSVTLPETATALGSSSMEAMENLKEVVLPDSITTLGDRCFAATELTRLNVPLSLEQVGEDICLSESLITVDIPDGLTVIPAGLLGSARVGYVNIPASVIEIGENAFTAEYVVLNNMDCAIAENSITTTALYLNGIYSTEQMPADLANIYVWRQTFLPMDASIDESDALDAYLLENGLEETAWIGIAPGFYDLDFMDYIADEEDHYKLAAYVGNKSSVFIPYVNSESVPIRKLGSGAFAATTGIKELSLGQVYVIEDNAFEGLGELTDLWLNGTMVYYAGREGCLSANSFTGISSTVTVHYPDSFTDDELETLKSAYAQAGMPEGVTYESYSLREKN